MNTPNSQRYDPRSPSDTEDVESFDIRPEPQRHNSRRARQRSTRSSQHILVDTDSDPELRYYQGGPPRRPTTDRETQPDLPRRHLPRRRGRRNSQYHDTLSSNPEPRNESCDPGHREHTFTNTFPQTSSGSLQNPPLWSTMSHPVKAVRGLGTLMYQLKCSEHLQQVHRGRIRRLSDTWQDHLNQRIDTKTFYREADGDIRPLLIELADTDSRHFADSACHEWLRSISKCLLSTSSRGGEIFQDYAAALEGSLAMLSDLDEDLVASSEAERELENELADLERRVSEWELENGRLRRDYGDTSRYRY